MARCSGRPIIVSLAVELSRSLSPSIYLFACVSKFSRSCWVSQCGRRCGQRGITGHAFYPLFLVAYSFLAWPSVAQFEAEMKLIIIVRAAGTDDRHLLQWPLFSHLRLLLAPKSRHILDLLLYVLMSPFSSGQTFRQFLLLVQFSFPFS